MTLKNVIKYFHWYYKFFSYYPYCRQSIYYLPDFESKEMPCNWPTLFTTPLCTYTHHHLILICLSKLLIVFHLINGSIKNLFPFGVVKILCQIAKYAFIVIDHITEPVIHSSDSHVKYCIESFMCFSSIILLIFPHWLFVRFNRLQASFLKKLSL